MLVGFWLVWWDFNMIQDERAECSSLGECRVTWLPVACLHCGVNVCLPVWGSIGGWNVSLEMAVPARQRWLLLTNALGGPTTPWQAGWETKQSKLLWTINTISQSAFIFDRFNSITFLFSHILLFTAVLKTQNLKTKHIKGKKNTHLPFTSVKELWLRVDSQNKQPKCSTKDGNWVPPFKHKHLHPFFTQQWTINNNCSLLWSK